MIFGNGSWGKTQYLLERSMDTEMVRRKVIANNIANADVPHFKRSEVTFEAELRRALDSERIVKENTVPTRMSHGKHIPFFKSMNYKSVSPKKHLDYLTTMRNDGNNIDPEKEIQDMLKNQLRYQALTGMLNHNNRVLHTVMRPA
ncbi:MAG: flagellar basal body rod protein FlgB [Leptospirales bacterium]